MAFNDGGSTNYLVKIVVVRGNFVGVENLLTESFLHFQKKIDGVSFANKMAAK